MANPLSYEFVTTQPGVKVLCERLERASWVALDTEFMREKTYYPELCLLQLATPEWAVCVDPLARLDLSPLYDALYRADLVKVFHAASQDLEIFYNLHGKLPVPLFDTQLAAPLLGYADQIGYGNLVTEALGPKLEKAHARADWSYRPLSDEQLRYAADDVIYLARLYPLLLEQLEARGRRAWLDPELAQLADPARYANPPEQAWKRIRSADRLKGAQLAVLQALAAWRERSAKEDNRPRGWLMRDDVLLDIARHQPASPAALGRIRGLHEGTAKRYADAILEVVAKGKQQTPEKADRGERHERPSPLQEAVVDVLMAVIRVKGSEESLNPAVLASRKDVIRLVMGDATGPLTQGWRKALLGEQLQEVLDGRRSVRVVNGVLHLESAR